MMRFPIAVLSLAFLPQTQDATIPAGAPPLHTVQGRGVQIYSCEQQGGVVSWSFQAPKATLFDASTQEQVGTHGAGPVWTWKDGSSVRGKAVQKAPSPDAGSIPWLLLAAEPVPGSRGALSGVAWIRRSETQGGNAPATGCDRAHVGATVSVPYQATYTFYAAGSKPLPPGPQ